MNTNDIFCNLRYTHNQYFSLLMEKMQFKKGLQNLKIQTYTCRLQDLGNTFLFFLNIYSH